MRLSLSLVTCVCRCSGFTCGLLVQPAWDCLLSPRWYTWVSSVTFSGILCASASAPSPLPLPRMPGTCLLRPLAGLRDCIRFHIVLLAPFSLTWPPLAFPCLPLVPYAVLTVTIFFFLVLFIPLLFPDHSTQNNPLLIIEAQETVIALVLRNIRNKHPEFH